MMGFLAAVFTIATVMTTWRFHLVIESSLNLRFDNHDLIENLQAAKNQADALNRELEQRVQRSHRQADRGRSAERRVPGNACARAPESARTHPVRAGNAEARNTAADCGSCP